MRDQVAQLGPGAECMSVLRDGKVLVRSTKDLPDAVVAPMVPARSGYRPASAASTLPDFI
jgi:hypothetical protein